ncbi:MAG: hypothetical protein ACTSRP_12105 [Candidatus Helarchaeota archaeon]
MSSKKNERDNHEYLIKKFKNKIEQIEAKSIKISDIAKYLKINEDVVVELAEELGYRVSKSRIYKKIETTPLVIRLDEQSIKMIEKCIPIIGTTKAAVIRHMIEDFYRRNWKRIKEEKMSLEEDW